MSFERDNSEYICSYSAVRHLELIADPDCAHRCITNGNKKVIGFFILMGMNSPNRELEFRRIGVGEKRKGHGRAALRYIKDLCFGELGFHRLWLDVFDDNERAISLYESEGFVMEALLRENVAANGGFRSQRIYSMLEDEYKQYAKTIT